MSTLASVILERLRKDVITPEMDIMLHVNYISKTSAMRGVVLPTPFLSTPRKETPAPRTSIPANIRPRPLTVAPLGTGSSGPRPPFQ